MFTLFAILSAPFWMHYAGVKAHCPNFRIFSAIFQVSRILEFLQWFLYQPYVECRELWIFLQALPVSSYNPAKKRLMQTAHHLSFLVWINNIVFCRVCLIPEITPLLWSLSILISHEFSKSLSISVVLPYMPLLLQKLMLTLCFTFRSWCIIIWCEWRFRATKRSVCQGSNQSIMGCSPDGDDA